MDNLLLNEYLLLMKAYNLKSVDKLNDIHMQAWAIQEIKATKRNGEPYYDTFDKFFDHEKQVNEILKPEPKKKKRTKIEMLLLKANS